MELNIQTDLNTALPAVIEFNYEQLKGQLAVQLERYQNLVVTEDAIKEAKADRASLRKLSEALETKRKEVKKRCLAPYTDFEAKIRELVGMIDAPVQAIDGQIKAFEDAKRETKRGEITAFYAQTAGDLAGMVPLSVLWRDEWLNATVSLKKVREEITARLERVRADLQVLDTVEGEFLEAVKLKYLEHLDVSEALAERKRLQEQAEKLRSYEEQRRRRAQEEAMEALRTQARGGLEPAEEPAGPDPRPAREEAEPAGEAAGQGREEQRYRLRFECLVTLAQAQALAGFLTEQHIEFRRV